MGQSREIELGMIFSSNFSGRRELPTFSTSSGSDITAVLSGASVRVFESEDASLLSCDVPHPESASQFRTASGSQPRSYRFR
jgi:hypothetical protein